MKLFIVNVNAFFEDEKFINYGFSGKRSKANIVLSTNCIINSNLMWTSIQIHSAIQNGKRISWNQSRFERCAVQAMRMSQLDFAAFWHLRRRFRNAFYWFFARAFKVNKTNHLTFHVNSEQKLNWIWAVISIQLLNVEFI